MIFLLLVLAVAACSANEKFKDFAEANNHFAPNIYKQVSTEETGNVVVSPLSAETVLALLLEGCKGDTAQELSSVLHFTNSTQKKQIKDFLTDLQSDDLVKFNIANGVFLQQDFGILPSFRSVATEDFGAKIENLDFGKSAEAAASINQWVEKITSNTIKNLIEPTSLSPATSLVLVNALHFKGNWSVRFSERDTTKKSFYKSETDEVQVDTLVLREKHLDYYEAENAQYLELPFLGNDASMVFVVPKKNVGFGDLEKGVSFLNIPFNLTYLNVEIPKFKFEFKTSLKKMLQNLGANKIFNGGDLSGITGKSGELKVNEVIQKAFIDLNEYGVEAAAATYIDGFGSAFITDTPKEFKANRPFIFFIKYKGIIAFAGKVTNPTY